MGENKQKAVEVIQARAREMQARAREMQAAAERQKNARAEATRLGNARDLQTAVRRIFDDETLDLEEATEVDLGDGTFLYHDTETVVRARRCEVSGCDGYAWRRELWGHQYDDFLSDFDIMRARCGRCRMWLFFDLDPTPEEKRASMSYMLGFTDGLMWALCHQEELPAMLREAIDTPVHETRPRIQSVSFEASELFGAAGADPFTWRGEDEIVRLKPDPDWRPPS